MILTSEEKEEIITSLSVRCGYIETDTCHRAKDLVQAGQKDDIKVLSTDQMRKIIFLEDLMSKIINNK